MVDHTKRHADLARMNAIDVVDHTKRNADLARVKAMDVAKNPVFQVTSASTVVGGVTGVVVGSTIGTVTGAAIGLVPALFTFGLSIPAGAAMGFCTGAVAGSTTGAVGGGALGYGGITYRKEIDANVRGAWGRMRTTVEHAKSKAADSASQMKGSVMALVGGSTGGTA